MRKERFYYYEQTSVNVSATFGSLAVRVAAQELAHDVLATSVGCAPPVDGDCAGGRRLDLVEPIDGQEKAIARAERYARDGGEAREGELCRNAHGVIKRHRRSITIAVTVRVKQCR